MDNSINTNKISHFIFFLILAYITLIIAAKCGTSYDAYWHIKVGEWILQQQQAPSTGIFSYSKGDSSWVAHEWLSSTIIYFVYKLGGWPGMIFMATASVAASLLLMANYTLKHLNINITIIFMLFAFFLLAPHILPRPHILALPIVTYWTSKLIDASDRLTSPSPYLAILMILWSNMHGSFIIGIVFCFYFAVEAITKAQTTNKRLTLAKSWGLLTLLSIIASVITPHGFDSLLMPFQLINQNYVISIVSEWASPNFHSIQALEVWLLSLLILCFTLGIKIPLFRMIFLLGLIHLSLKHARHSADLLSVLSPLILALPLGKQLNIKTNFNLKQVFTLKPFYWLIIALLTFLLFFFIDNRKNIQAPEHQQLSKILLALKPEQKKLGHVLNSYGTGGFLIYHSYDVFMDTRAELYKDDFVKSYFDAINLINGPDDLEKIISSYNVKWTLFETPEKINTYLLYQKDWNPIYSDKHFTLFKHNSIILKDQTYKKLSILENISTEQEKL
ncbi:MAG: hypothetical protein KAJ03_02240 [Gammaproteobacteria bacterium]|nr:hypothetical protein [Gammaproteobacteria bacterium]